MKKGTLCGVHHLPALKYGYFNNVISCLSLPPILGSPRRQSNPSSPSTKRSVSVNCLTAGFQAAQARVRRHMAGWDLGLLGAPRTHTHTHARTASHEMAQVLDSAHAGRAGSSGAALPPGWLGKGAAAGGGPRPGKGERAGAVGLVAVASLQGLQHQQLLQHLRLAGLSDLTRQEHLVHHRVNLVEVEHQVQFTDIVEVLV